MDIKRGSQPCRASLKRLGKKAIFYGRIACALGTAQQGSKRPRARFEQAIRRVRSVRPTRKQWAVSVTALVLAVTGVMGNSLYQSQRANAAKAAEVAELKRVEQKNAVAQECYKKKTAEKQAMLGKVTFDQLYDGDSCLTEQ